MPELEGHKVQIEAIILIMWIKDALKTSLLENLSKHIVY